MTVFESAVKKKIVETKMKLAQRKIPPQKGMAMLKALNEMLKACDADSPLTDLQSA